LLQDSTQVVLFSLDQHDNFPLTCFNCVNAKVNNCMNCSSYWDTCTLAVDRKKTIYDENTI